MPTQELYSLNRASRVLGEDRNLITFLVRERQIPVRYVGASKCLDAVGFRALQEALVEYRMKPDAVLA